MNDFEKQRVSMVKHQLQGRDIVDPAVVKAFSAVPREAFVGSDMKPYAYEDRPLPIGHGQTISQPYIVALTLQYLDVPVGQRVLEIGTGSGYQTALLAEIGCGVWTVERIERLFLRAKGVLDGMGYAGIHYRYGDGCQGWPEAAPFDRIVVSASTPAPPEPLTAQLAEGGVMLIPLGPAGYQVLTRIERRSGALHRTALESCVFVPLLPGQQDDEPGS